MELPPLFGGTLITVATNDGIVMAADDLVYAEKGSDPVPVGQCVQKVFVCKQNILVGTAGVMSHPSIEYKAENWILEFIEAHASASFEHPDVIAADLQMKARDTFEKLASIKEDSIWETYLPGQRVVTYFVAGYAESFRRPYLFEIGAEVNSDRNGLIYSSTACARPESPHWIGEDSYWQNAANGHEPGASKRDTIRSGLTPVVPMTDIPSALQEVVTALASLIKVEAHFNPKRVGARVDSR